MWPFSRKKRREGDADKVPARLAAAALSSLVEDEGAGYRAADISEIFEEAENGNPERQARLWEDMLDRDMHLASLVQDRKNLLTAGRIRLRAPEGVGDAAITTEDRYLEFRNELFNVVDVSGILEMLAESIFIGYAGIGLSWADGHIDEIYPVHATRWRFEDGVPKVNEVDITRLPVGQFIYAAPRTWSLNPVKGGIVRRVAWGFYFKHATTKYWARFLERYGVPPLIAQVERSTFMNRTLRERLLAALKGMANAGVVVVPSVRDGSSNGGSPIQAVSMPGSYNRLHSDASAYIDRTMTLLILGQIGSTEGEPGRLGRNQGMDNIMRTLIKSDCRFFGRVLTTQLVRPMWEYGGFGKPEDVPELVIEPDLTDFLAIYSKAIAVLAKAGYRIDINDAERLLGFALEQKGASEEE